MCDFTTELKNGLRWIEEAGSEAYLPYTKAEPRNLMEITSPDEFLPLVGLRGWYVEIADVLNTHYPQLSDTLEVWVGDTPDQPDPELFNSLVLILKNLEKYIADVAAFDFIKRYSDYWNSMFASSTPRDRLIGCDGWLSSIYIIDRLRPPTRNH